MYRYMHVTNRIVPYWDSWSSNGQGWLANFGWYWLLGVSEVVLTQPCKACALSCPFGWPTWAKRHFALSEASPPQSMGCSKVHTHYGYDMLLRCHWRCGRVICTRHALTLAFGTCAVRKSAGAGPRPSDESQAAHGRHGAGLHQAQNLQDLGACGVRCHARVPAGTRRSCAARITRAPCLASGCCRAAQWQVAARQPFGLRGATSSTTEN